MFDTNDFVLTLSSKVDEELQQIGTMPLSGLMESYTTHYNYFASPEIVTLVNDTNIKIELLAASVDGKLKG
ncbi:hypothetical protein [Vreelandella titanicae]|uniref:hypothetical protein n=1 Tax=Vreelandella titanicae TaxID=664683 RepID=UPI00114270BF|nr:hypothetical protein [Halomonas titanicae]